MKNFLTIDQFGIAGRAVASPEIDFSAKLEMIYPEQTRLSLQGQPCADVSGDPYRRGGVKSEASLQRSDAQITLSVSLLGNEVPWTQYLGQDFKRAINTYLPSHSQSVYVTGHWMGGGNRGLLRLLNQSKSLSECAEIGHSISLPDVDHISALVDLIGSKELASFLGRYIALSEGAARVSLLNEASGERFEADCDASVLRQKGIKEGTEFMCKVTRRAAQTVVEFVPLPPKALSRQELSEISEEVDSRIN